MSDEQDSLQIAANGRLMILEAPDGAEPCYALAFKLSDGRYLFQVPQSTEDLAHLAAFITQLINRNGSAHVQSESKPTDFDTN